MTSGDFLFLCRAFWMEAGSEGRLANWWNTLRLRMMAYTRLQFPGGRADRCLSVFKTITVVLRHVPLFFLPSNWYWIILLKASRRKKTR